MTATLQKTLMSESSICHFHLGWYQGNFSTEMVPSCKKIQQISYITKYFSIKNAKKVKKKFKISFSLTGLKLSNLKLVEQFKLQFSFVITKSLDFLMKAMKNLGFLTVPLQ